MLGDDAGTGDVHVSLSNDFTVYIGKTMNDSEKLTALESHFKPDKLYLFPKHEEYGKQRSCNPVWFERYKWLVYSPARDGVYCKYCSLFGATSKEINYSKLDRLVKSPLTFWTSATNKLHEHDTKSAVHRSATIIANEFLKTMKGQQKSVVEQLDSVLSAQMQRNREKLYSIVKTILFCGRQNIALRGHRESEEGSSNVGNFRELLKFRVDSGDKLLEDHLTTAPRNATYTSNTTQNNLISIVGKWIQDKILKEIQEGSKVFSVIADEARDCSNKEQMPLIIRYVDRNSTIIECFICFIECKHGTSGSQLATLIESTCINAGFDMTLCRGQGYDGAGNMAGKCVGAAKLLRDKYPKAFYLHCASHRLNLCVVHCLQLTSVSNMFSVVTSIANFFNFSPKRQKCLEDNVGKCADSLKKKLLPLCRTRWVERINALEVTVDLLKAVVQSFCDMLENGKQWNRDTVNQASSLIKSIDFEFIINLLTVQRIMAYTSGVTTALQKQGIDFINVCSQIQVLIKALQNTRQRVDQFHKECFNEACDIARMLDVDIKNPRVCGRQTHRQNTMSSSESLTPKQQVENYFRLNVTIPLLDDITNCLNDKFAEGQYDVMRGDMLIPSSVITVPNWKENLKPFLALYADEIPSARTIEAELLLWEQLWNDKWISNLKALNDQQLKAFGKRLNVTDTELKQLKKANVPNTISTSLVETDSDIYPNIYYLLCILAVLPITTCEAERTVSCLRRLKTYMRSAMGQGRLTGLALMHIHRNMDVNIDDIVQTFAIEHPRRMQLVNILD